MGYLFMGIAFILCIIPLLILKFLKPNKLALFNRILTFILIAIFMVRFFCYKNEMMYYINYPLIEVKAYPTSIGVLSAIFLWLAIGSTLLICIRNFYNIKAVNSMVKFIAPIILIGCICLFTPMVRLSEGTFNISWLMVTFAIEIAISAVLVISYWMIDHSIKMSFKDIVIFVGGFLLLLISCMPTYFLQFVFGNAKGLIKVIDFSRSHRYVLYLGVFIVPFSIYFILHNQSDEVRWFALTYVCLGTLTNFCTNMDYTWFAMPWRWPFHLCNTAMFILPFCIVFKAKRFFYFSIFLNVAGAFFALLFPDYPEAANIISARLVQYWYNHYIAFFMPILFIALRIFPRPKFKQFWYSVLFFTIYFALILFLNPYFTALGHKCDFFFINSTFIAKKFGKWAVDLYNLSASVTIGGITLQFHPFYQLGYYLCYILISLATWFLYILGFDISDRVATLYHKLKQQRQMDKELKLKLDGRSVDQPLEENASIKIELKDFSKKYAISNKFAVSNANLVVNGGEIFGFLGPNGAGKSTIIKAIVGIHGITSGNISICGFDREMQDLQAKDLIGFVPDHYALYETLTGREYLNYIADIYKVKKEDRIKRMHKYLTLFEMENNIDSMIKTYSHGMKQKITIMAALIHNPKVWILDEPLTGLDPNSIYQVKECMKQHASEGNVVFFSSHIIDVVEKLCQRIAIIKHGHIQCVKTVDEIERSGQSLEEFYLEIVGDNKDE